MSNTFASDYIDVATRIAEFRKKYPDGSLQPADLGQPFTMLEVDGARFVVVVAAAYRSENDARPGVGMAQEQIPGRTPYTRGSELQNAETSAWGRAIVAALAADTKKGVASADEVRNRQADNEADPLPRAPRKRGATTRHNGPDDPTTHVDEWTVATDVAWLTDARTRLTACGSVGEVRGLWEEAAQVQAEGRLTHDDAAAFKDEMTQRSTELTAAS